MSFEVSFLWQVFGTLIAAGAVYGGIRADIKGLHAQVAEALKSAARAHERIDTHLEKT